MTDADFYEACAALLGTVYVCKPFPWPTHHRTRWNNRAPDSGRFPGQGLVRLFGDNVQIALRHPVAINVTVHSREEALKLIAAAIPTPKRIVRISVLAQVEGGRMMLVRKRGIEAWIQPGGKVERGEGDIEALRRECLEETGCAVGAITLLGSFREVAAGDPGVHVEAVVHLGTLEGTPTPRAEIEEIAWVDMAAPQVPVAPSLSNLIFPVMLSMAKI